MKEVVSLNIKFRGSRDYLHGTDLFNTLVEKTGSHSNLRLRIYRPMRGAVRFYELDQTSSISQSPAAIFESKINLQKHTWFVVDAPQSPRPKSYFPDETAILKNCRIFDEAISQSVSAGGTFIERVVGLKKELLIRKAGEVKIWQFVRIDLEALQPDGIDLRLSVDGRLKNRLVRSTIFCNGKKVGSIYFSGEGS